MVLHLPHKEGGFGVTFNDVTKDYSFYIHDGLLRPSFLHYLLHDIHDGLLVKYDCKDTVPPQSQTGRLVHPVPITRVTRLGG